MKNLYFETLNKLRLNNINNAELDLRIIINNSLIKKKESLIQDIKLRDINLRKFNLILKRRIKGEPLSKIFNNKEFWSLNYYTSNKVLDPRPETEFIVESVIKKFKNISSKKSILDLGTGSGCIIISILKHFKNFHGTGVDISKEAVLVAKKNSKKHLNNKRLKLLNKNWISIKKKYDIIVSNPPYIKKQEYDKLSKEVKLYDPKIALFAGNDGLQKYKQIAPIVYKCMKKKSLFFVEIPKNQKKSILEIFTKNKFKLLEVVFDYQKIERVLILKKL